MSRHCPIDVPDHELLSQLARNDPEAFEKLSRGLIDDFIECAPERYRRRLRGLQFRVDCIRRLTRTPLASLLRIQSLMWESFLKLDQELQNFGLCIHGNPVSIDDATDETTRLATDLSCRGQVIELRSYLLNHRSG